MESSDSQHHRYQDLSPRRSPRGGRGSASSSNAGRRRLHNINDEEPVSEVLAREAEIAVNSIAVLVSPAPASPAALSDAEVTRRVEAANVSPVSPSPTPPIPIAGLNGPQVLHPLISTVSNSSLAVASQHTALVTEQVIHSTRRRLFSEDGSGQEEVEDSQPSRNRGKGKTSGDRVGKGVVSTPGSGVVRHLPLNSSRGLEPSEPDAPRMDTPDPDIDKIVDSALSKQIPRHANQYTKILAKELYENFKKLDTKMDETEKHSTALAAIERGKVPNGKNRHKTPFASEFNSSEFRDTAYSETISWKGLSVSIEFPKGSYDDYREAWHMLHMKITSGIDAEITTKMQSVLETRTSYRYFHDKIMAKINKVKVRDAFNSSVDGAETLWKSTPQTEANIKLTYKKIRDKASNERISRIAQAERTEAEKVKIHEKLEAESPADHLRHAWKSRNASSSKDIGKFAVDHFGLYMEKTHGTDIDIDYNKFMRPKNVKSSPVSGEVKSGRGKADTSGKGDKAGTKATPGPKGGKGGKGKGKGKGKINEKPTGRGQQPTGRGQQADKAPKAPKGRKPKGRGRK